MDALKGCYIPNILRLQPVFFKQSKLKSAIIPCHIWLQLNLIFKFCCPLYRNPLQFLSPS